MASGKNVDQQLGRGDENGGQAPQLKRRRVALACNACRIRKSRCDGAQPKCSLCDQLDFDCTYIATDTAANVIVRKDYMNGFEQRLKYLEDSVKRHDELLKCHSNGESVTPTIEASPSKRVRFGNTISLNEAELQELPSEETITDGMAMSFVDEEDSGFFGLSSNIALIRHISRAMAAVGNAAELRTPTMSDDPGQMDNGIISASMPVSPSSRHQSKTRDLEVKVSIFDLPSEHETRELMRQYFSNTGLLFPYIHEPSFLECYEQMKTDDFKKVRRTWLGLLNMILAMATSTLASSEKSAAERVLDSDRFYQRAHQLCRRQMLRGTSLETVQYLLLMSQYLQGTQKSVQTWAIHGLAVKAALSLGLHSTDASKKFPPIEREMRKRTWYGCVMLDRSLSMTFGRPSAIPQDYVRQPLPETLDNEELSAVPQDNIDILSVRFFSASITLYKIQWKIIATLYGQNLGCDQPLSEMEIVTEVLKLEQELTEWQQSLHPVLYLRTPDAILTNDMTNFAEERFRVVLTLRHLNIQVLLHRPFLVRSLDLRRKILGQRHGGRSADHMASGSIQTCVRSSEDIISIIHSIITVTDGKGILGAWWFSLYYTFNAALIIFGSLLVSPQHSFITTTLFDQIEHVNFFLEKAVQAMRQLDEGNEIITRCAEYVQRLSGMASQWAQTVSNNPSLDGMSSDLPIPQQIFLPQDTGGFEIPYVASSLDMDSYLTNDLELGQFFIPDEMGKWINNGRGRQNPQGLV